MMIFLANTLLISYYKVSGKKRDFAFVQKNKWSTISRHPPFAQIYAKTSAKLQH